jgi:hypothetical protein
MPPELIVNQGSVTYDDNAGQIIDPNNYAGVFANYFFENHYEQDLHTYMASQTTSTPFNGSLVGMVRIGGPTLLWVCEWTACQLGALPTAPSPVPESSGWVLLDIQPTLAGKSIAEDGVSPLYRISGVYVYGHKNPNADVFKDAVFPVYPWVADTSDRVMTSANIKKGLIDGVNTGGRERLNGSAQVREG